MKAARFWSRLLALSVSLTGLIQVANAQLGQNLIVNGDASSGVIADNQEGNEPGAPVPTGWTRIEGGYFAVNPTNAYWGGTVIGPSVTSSYFVGGRAVGYSVLRQRVDLSALSGEIDTGLVVATLGARIGTWRFDLDSSEVIVRFYDQGGSPIGELSTIETSNAVYNDIGRDGGTFGSGIDYDVNLTPVPPSTTIVPPGTRYADVDLVARRHTGTDMDSYMDDVYLVLKPMADLTDDGCVDDGDLAQVIFNFGMGCF